MSREILFRGKRVDNNQWTEGFLSFIYTDGRNSNGFIYTDKAQIYSPVEVRSHDVYTSTVGQFTGLCDKNGVKIFEGDKLYCEARLDKAEMYVVFEQGQFRMVLCDKFKEYETGRGYYDINCFQKTVIGNIHDTPNVLKEEAE